MTKSDGSGAMIKRPRVRRELRSLGELEEQHFVEAVKEMLAAGESAEAFAHAEERFGPRFRSTAYLSIKHGIAALHSECDQVSCISSSFDTFSLLCSNNLEMHDSCKGPLGCKSDCISQSAAT